MKNQALISSKDKTKTLKCRLLQFSFGALRIKDIIPDCLRSGLSWFNWWVSFAPDF